MNRYYGAIGYGITEDKGDGVWDQKTTERFYYGDVMQNSRKWEKGEGRNDNLNINNRISIVADAFAYSHFADIRYASWMDSKWKVTDVTVQAPRLILTLGGVYNGPED